MTMIRTQPDHSAPDARPRARLSADAVVSAYLAEIAGVWRRRPGVPDPAAARRAVARPAAARRPCARVRRQLVLASVATR